MTSPNNQKDLAWITSQTMGNGWSVFMRRREGRQATADAICRLLERHIKAPKSLRCTFVERRTETTAEFSFVFRALIPGSYRVVVGYKSVTLENGDLRTGIPFLNHGFIDALKDAVAEMARYSDNGIFRLVESENMKALLKYARNRDVMPRANRRTGKKEEHANE